MNVIVVDDEQASINLFMSDFAVDSVDINVHPFRNNPLMALEYVAKNPVDVAFLDINMPAIDGILLAEKLLEVNPDLRLVFISGYEQNEESLKKRFNGNLAGFFNKPYQENELRRIINEIIYNSRHETVITCFGTFTVTVNKEIVRFETKKSRELLALLVNENGNVADSGFLATRLWPDKDDKSGKTLYKDTIYRLRKTLNAYGVGNILEQGRGWARVKKEGVDCDYWSYEEKPFVLGEGRAYLPEYEWAAEKNNYIVMRSKNI